MNNIMFIYYIFALSAGMFCLGCLFMIFLNNNDNAAIKIYLLFYSSFSALVIFTVLRTFLQEEMTDDRIVDSLAAIQFLALDLSLLILACLLNKVLLIQNFSRNFVLLITFTTCSYFLSVMGQIFMTISIDEPFFVVMFIYYFIIFFKYRKNIVNDKLKKIMEFSYIISIIFIPGIVLDDVIASDGINLVFVPLLFSLIGVFSVVCFNRISNSVHNEKYTVPKEIIEKCGFTDREIEVMVLLCKGYSYNKIADELVISISTVRTHVTNIYKKASVNSRYELYNLIG